MSLVDLRPTDLNQIYEMFVSQSLQHPDLSESNLLNCRIILSLKKLLYRHQLERRRNKVDFTTTSSEPQSGRGIK